MSLIKLNRNLLLCHLFHKKLGQQSQQIFSTFKFNFIFTLLLTYAGTLLITNLIHVSLISNWFNYAVEYMILTSHRLPVQTHHNSFRPTLSNFFGKCEEIKSKLHSNILSLQWVWALSVGAKLFCDWHKIQISFTLLL